MTYECHITTTVAHAEACERIAKALHWKTSEIKRDPILGDGSYFYLTSHAATFEHMKLRMHAASIAMKSDGIPVLREKIEHIVYDTKTKIGVTE